MIAGKFLVIAFLLWMPTALMADKGHIHLMLDETAETQLQLEVVQLPLAQALNEIANKTGISLHYSALPDGLFNVSCVESTVTAILKCLLDNKADYIIRYSKSISKSLLKNLPEEIWVLGTSLSVDDDVSFKRIPAEAQVTGRRVAGVAVDKGLANVQESVPGDSDEIIKLLKMATAKDPALRADAISDLVSKGAADDLAVRKVLADALSDKNAQVREQAVSGLARREGDKAAAELQLALEDSDSSVRLMVVDNAGENMALLQQALSDSDETMRTLAAMKLDEISKAGTGK